MKRWVKFGLLNALVGVIIGVQITIAAIGSGYWVLILAAPVAVFLTAGLVWRFLQGEANPIQSKRLFTIGLLTGTVSHYLTWILLDVALDLLWWAGIYSGSSLGDPPPSFLESLKWSFTGTFISLLVYGWITVPASILAGFVVRRLEDGSARTD